MACMRAETLAHWMRQYLVPAGCGGFIVGLSGGVDSAVVLRLAQLATPNATLGAIMPCHSDPRDEHDAAIVAGHFSVPTIRIDLSSSYDGLIATLQPAIQSLPNQKRGTAPAD